MTQENPRKFIGRAIVIDQSTARTWSVSAYVCVLLTGATGVPSVILGEAPTLDGLMKKLRASDLYAHFAKAKLTFEPPISHWPISHTSARQRYEALSLDELSRVQTIMSGR
ncbi:MAG: hypothetical protein AAB554_05635 [Patescibacteria group bacterium]